MVYMNLSQSLRCVVLWDSTPQFWVILGKFAYFWLILAIFRTKIAIYGYLFNILFIFGPKMAIFGHPIVYPYLCQSKFDDFGLKSQNKGKKINFTLAINTQSPSNKIIYSNK